MCPSQAAVIFGVSDLTWVLHALQFLRASLFHSRVLPSDHFQLCPQQYPLAHSSKPVSLLSSSQVLFWDASPTFSRFSSFLLSPTPSGCHPSPGTSDQRHSVLLWLMEELRHAGLSPSFLESSRTCYDWHMEANGLLLQAPSAPVINPCLSWLIQSHMFLSCYTSSVSTVS